MCASEYLVSINVDSVVGATKPIFTVPLFSQNDRSWTAETPDKYERDWNYLAYTFAK